jgi:hypothetical protein
VMRKSVLLMSKAGARPCGEASTCGLPALERRSARVLGSKSPLRPTSRSALRAPLTSASCLCFVAVWFWVRARRYTGFLFGCCALARAALVVAVVVAG